MSWLSQGLSDIGLGGVNTFFNTAIKPALENPAVDVGLGLGAAALTGGLLAPEIGGLLGVGDAAATTAAGAPLDLSAVAAGDVGGSAALGFGSDVAATPSLASFLADPASSGLALQSGLDANIIPGAGFGTASDLTGGSALGDIYSSSVFDPATWGTTAASTAAPVSNALDINAVNTAVDAANASQPGILSTIGSYLSPISSAAKTLAPIAGLGGLGYNLYQGYETKQALNQLASTEQQQAATQQQIAQAATSAAEPIISQGTALQQYLATGTLPQAFQAQLNQQIAAAKASVIQGYASRGMNTDPTQNSALAQDLTNVDQQGLSLQSNLETQLANAGNAMITTANQLLSSGASATQISTQLPIQVAQLNATLNQQTSAAISSFAAAMNSGGSLTGGQKVTLQLAP